MRGARWLTRRRLVGSLVLLVLLGGAGVLLWWAIRDEPRYVVIWSPPPKTPAEEAAQAELARLQHIGNDLQNLQPGTSRGDVETILGRPHPDDIGPVGLVDGRRVYHVRYRAVLNAPPPSAPNVNGYCEAELSFDASRNGHPLVGIRYTAKQPPGSLILVRPT